MLTDEELQARLAAAFHEQADPVSGAVFDGAAIFRAAIGRKSRWRALVPQRASGTRQVPGVRTPRGRLMAATASAAAVVLLAAGTWLLTHPVASSHAPVTGSVSPSISASGLASRSPGPSPAPSQSTRAVSADGVPPYYIVMDDAQPDVDIFASAAGALLSTVRLPDASHVFPGAARVAADGDNSTFVLADLEADTTRFYLLHVTNGGSGYITSTLVPPLQEPAEVVAMAASPGGSELAISVDNTNVSNSGYVEVVAMATGAIRRIWSTDNDGSASTVSWADGGSELGIWIFDRRGQDSGLWLLSASAPAGSLASGHLVLPQTTANGTIYEDALLTPGGTTAIVEINSASDGASGLVVVSLRTGVITQVLTTQMLATGDGIVAIDPTGHYLLVQGRSSSFGFGRLDGSSFRRLPVPADNHGSAGAAAW
jgi:hypothetical protein